MITNTNIFTLLVFVIAAGYLIEDVSPANILGVIPFYISSHHAIVHPIFMELAKRGHNVTVISSIKEINLPPNYRHIQVDQISPASVFSPDEKEPNLFEMKMNGPLLMQVWFTFHMFMKYAEKLMKSEAVQDFILNDQSHFDLVIAEDFRFAPFYMFAHKYNAPLVTMVTFGTPHWVNNYMANPLNLHYVGHEMSPLANRLSLYERLMNVVNTLVDLITKKYFLDPLNDRIAQELFGHLPQPLPTATELERNVSLVLTNSHFSMGTVAPRLPNMVEIAGIHIKPPKKLPDDLQKILDQAKHGVIYFSMGSNLKSKSLPKEKRDALLKVFGGLQQTVLWKWEDEQLPGQPKNVIIRKWYPQNDILAHPNIRLFITHGGLLSTQEAVYRGVPLIGIPIFGDQPRNVLKATVSGYAEGIAYEDLTEGKIKEVIDKVLSNPSYKQKVKELSMIVNDKPMTSLDTATFWVEYVIRHKGAYHMKTPASDMNWIEYNLIDVILILVVIQIMILYFAYLTMKFLFRCICNRKSKKDKPSRNKKSD